MNQDIADGSLPMCLECGSAPCTCQKKTNAPQQQAEALAKSFKESNTEMFEDGVEADLHDAGITTLAAAYRLGKEDQIDEVFAQLPLTELLACASALEQCQGAIYGYKSSNYLHPDSVLARAHNAAKESLAALRAKLPKE